MRVRHGWSACPFITQRSTDARRFTLTSEIPVASDMTASFPKAGDKERLGALSLFERR